jgi:hypothetical protein
MLSQLLSQLLPAPEPASAPESCTHRPSPTCSQTTSALCCVSRSTTDEQLVGTPSGHSESPQRHSTS